MYTEKAFKNELIAQTHPEILRSNLATVVLQLKKLKIDDLVHFDFMDPPAPETMMRALEVRALCCLGVLTGWSNETGAQLPRRAGRRRQLDGPWRHHVRISARPAAGQVPADRAAVSLLERTVVDRSHVVGQSACVLATRCALTRVGEQVPNVFLRPRDASQQADAAKARFTHADGDHLTLLNVYHA